MRKMILLLVGDDVCDNNFNGVVVNDGLPFPKKKKKLLFRHKKIFVEEILWEDKCVKRLLDLLRIFMVAVCFMKLFL